LDPKGNRMDRETAVCRSLLRSNGEELDDDRH